MQAPEIGGHQLAIVSKEEEKGGKDRRVNTSEGYGRGRGGDTTEESTQEVRY